MAELHRIGDEVQVRLSTIEKIAALRGDLRVPVSAVTRVDVVDTPLTAVTGVRAPGLHWPGRTKIGTWRRRDGKTFAVARSGVPAVQVDLAGQRFDRLVVSVGDADEVAATLR